MKLVAFPNDGGVSVIIPEIQKYEKNNNFMKFRPYHEFMFRKISEYIIKKTGKGNIIDLGAWIGDNSIPWAKMIKDYGIVYAIDPSPDNCEYISTLCELNNVTNVRIVQKPISDKEEVISTGGDLWHCSFKPGEEGKIKLTATSIDNLKDIIKDVSYIHLDVEGMEYNVLIGAEKLIRELNPIICYEVHLSEVENVTKIKSLLKSWDYEIYMINEVLPECNIDCRNCLALPRTGGCLGKSPEDVILDICKYLNEGKYHIISHVKGVTRKSNYKTLTEAMNVFCMLNGGPYATVLLETQEESSSKILCKYGMEQYAELCISSHRYSYENIFTTVS